MKDKILLTIVIPVYKVEKYIQKTLDSIYNQCFLQDELEVVVVNDGTPDNSMSIVSEYKGAHENLQIINQENKGLSGARNTGLRAAHGKYIWFVDSDDWLENGCLVNILNLLRKATDDVYVFRIKEYDEEGNLILERSNDFSLEHKCVGKECILNERFDCTPVQIYIFNHEFLIVNNLNFVEGLVHEDIEFAPRMLIAAKTVVFVPIFSYCYLRRTSGNITSNQTLSQHRLKSMIFIMERFGNLAKQTDDKEEKEIYIKCQVGIVLGIYYRATEEMIKNNAEGIMDGDYIKKCKCIVFHGLRYDNNLRHIMRKVLFLLSVKLYHRTMVRMYLKTGCLQK